MRREVTFHHCQFSNNTPRRSIVGLYGGAGATIFDVIFDDDSAGRTMIEADERGGTVLLERVCFLSNTCGDDGLVRVVNGNDLLYGVETAYGDGNNDTGGKCDDGTV